jgi:uncharacterized protein YqgC (DUF456 family)
MALFLLIVALASGLVLIPFGLPGLWVMVLGVIGYGWLTGFASVGVATIAIVLTLAALSEIIEAWVGFRSARRYGGSRRAGWGALIGGLVGAVVGVPVPIVGSIVGAFVGAFTGAAVFEFTAARRAGTALGAGWGAVVGRAIGAMVKVALGLAIGVVAIFAALRG